MWPLLLAVLLAGTRPWRPVAPRCAGYCCCAPRRRGVDRPARRDRTTPTDPGRAYYGTDTRGASLLIGAGLAVILARYRPDGRRGRTRLPSRCGRRSACRLRGAALGLAWAWTHADGGDRWLYRGGLAAARGGGRRPARARGARAPRLAGEAAGARAPGPARPDLLRRLPVALAGVHRRERRPHRPTGRRRCSSLRCLVTLGAGHALLRPGRATRPQALRRRTRSPRASSAGAACWPVSARSRLWCS